MTDSFRVRVERGLLKEASRVAEARGLQEGPEKRRCGPGVTLEQYGRFKLVSRSFHARFTLVSRSLEAFPFFLPPGPRAGHPRLAGPLALPSFFLPRCPRTGHRFCPASERRGVPKCPSLRYRVRKGWKGYRELTNFKPATCPGAVAGQAFLDSRAAALIMRSAV